MESEQLSCLCKLVASHRLKTTMPFPEVWSPRETSPLAGTLTHDSQPPASLASIWLSVWLSLRVLGYSLCTTVLRWFLGCTWLVQGSLCGFSAPWFHSPVLPVVLMSGSRCFTFLVPFSSCLWQEDEFYTFQYLMTRIVTFFGCSFCPCDFAFFVFHGQFRLISCSSCHFIFPEPLISSV